MTAAGSVTRARADLGARLSSTAAWFRRGVHRVRSGELSFAAVALVVVFGSLLGIVVLQTLIVQNRLEFDAINRRLDEAREENQRLRLEVIELEAPDRIQDAAVERFGMIRPDERRYLPGIDPEVVEVRLPPAGDPFGPAVLPAWLLEPTLPAAPATGVDEDTTLVDTDADEAEESAATAEAAADEGDGGEP